VGLKVIGVDPGFTYLGVCCATFWLGKPRPDIEELTLIETHKSNKKKGVRAKTDDLRRLGEIVEKFDEIVRHWPADVFSFEEIPSIRQNATTTRKIGMAWGACYAVARRRSGVLVFEYGPKELKLEVTGSAMASKEQMITVLESRYPALVESEVPDSKKEHVADAIAAVEIAVRDQAVLALANAFQKVE